MEAQRNIATLKESFSELEARVAALEEGKEELTDLRELIADKGNLISDCCLTMNKK